MEISASCLKRARKHNRAGYDRLARFLNMPDSLPHELARVLNRYSYYNGPGVNQ
jgi:hypothetical protein